jgi:hypothetical protein
MARRKGARAFIAKQDRPDVKISLDKAVTELKVRDLSEILAKAMWKHIKELKIEKVEIKEGKYEKLEHKELKIEKPWHKELKIEKIEKLENEPGPKHIWEPGPDPKSGAGEPGPDWGGFDPAVIDTLVQQVAKLSQVVADLQQRLK